MLNTLTQILVPTMTIGAQLVLALGFPKYSLLINIISQPFWLYSAYRAHKEAGQTGLLITGLIFTFITVFGLYRFWF
jgi:hypothetical protein